MNKYYILIEPYAVYVKDGKFFEGQGGLTAEWGESWKPIYADGIEHARLIGKNMRDYKADNNE